MYDTIANGKPGISISSPHFLARRGILVFLCAGAISLLVIVFTFQIVQVNIRVEVEV
jgi:hypothetical protein